MEKRRFYIIALLIISTITELSAQWDTQFSQYWEFKDYYNPSYVGYTDNLLCNFAYRYNYAALESSPTQTVITINSPISLLGYGHGAGIVLSTDKIGSLRNNSINLQYSYRYRFGSSAFNIGMRAGIHDINFDSNSLELIKDSTNLGKDRIVVTTTSKKQIFDVGTGISFINDRFNIGVAILHINQPEYYVINSADGMSDLINVNDSTASSIPITFNFLSSYNIKASNSLIVQPMLFGQYNKLESSLNLTIRVVANDKFSGGVSWITNQGFNLFAGISMKEFDIGYAFSNGQKGTSINNGGSHEIFFRYDLSKENSMTKYKRHKSIRLL
ncbi:MAG: PorP/SprF family type IX secretion system membrane protein [Fermentimonas sp.]|jgi:type IX secretion system PorP/SprF family membrane protein